MLLSSGILATVASAVVETAVLLNALAPRGAFDRTCYDYEPWHYRYVGWPLSAEIRASGLTPRQVLWGLQ